MTCHLVAHDETPAAACDWTVGNVTRTPASAIRRQPAAPA